MKTTATEFVKTTQIGKGIRCKFIKTSSLDFDPGHEHEMMITYLNLNEVDLQLVTNQGTIDSLQKYLDQTSVEYGAMINGGYYTLDNFYGLSGSAPIGLHKFSLNYKVSSHLAKIRSDFDNTENFNLPDDTTTTIPKKYKDKPIEARLHSKTQTPYAMRNEYGLMRITDKGEVDFRLLSDYQDPSFTDYIQSAQYLLSSGPILVWNKDIIFTKEKLESSGYQFQQIFEHFGSHPGAVPPGTFYHADQRNPRSGIALTETGECLMVTVKGNEEPKRRDGITLAQFASLMKSLGAVKAFNLDGGYSACQIAGSYRPFSESSYCKEGLSEEDILRQPPVFIPQAIKQCSRNGNTALLPCAIVATPKTVESTSERLTLRRDS